MATPTNPSIILPLATNYQDYFYCVKTNTFCRRYAAILYTCTIDPAASISPANVACLIYATAQ